MLTPRSADAGTVAAVLARAHNYDAVVLDGSARRDQIAAALLGTAPRRPALVIADSTWKRTGNRLERAAVRMMDGARTSFCVVSSFEAERFSATWGLRDSQVHLTLWPFTVSEAQRSKPVAENGRVFAGGDSLRDYGPLIAAANEIEAPVDIATRAPSDAWGATPGNVTVRAAPQIEYDEMLRCAAVVVVPLQPRTDRSSGQTTYVNAMALGKAVVVTDAPGVRDYIEDGETGVIVPAGDGPRMARAVQHLLDNPVERRKLGERAQAHALRHLTLAGYASRLLSVVDETLSAPAPARATRNRR